MSTPPFNTLQRIRFLLTGIVFCFVGSGFAPATGFAQEEDEARLWRFLSQEVHDLQIDKLPERDALRIVGEISKNLDKIDRHEIAESLLANCWEVTSKNKDASNPLALFYHAVTLQRLDLAEEFARKLENPGTLLDRLAVEKYRQGDRDAINGFPFSGELTFHSALDLANAYLKEGDFAAAEAFITDLVISEENDPRDVACIVLESIAKHYRENGDMEKAKDYIDKALEVGGRQFYTGYIIQVSHKSIHGTLIADLEETAQRGANYQGHHGRELVQSLIRELRDTGHFEEAKNTTRFLEDKEDISNSYRATAAAQARVADFDGARTTVNQIADPHIQDLAMLDIVQQLWRTGQTSEARKIVADLDQKSVTDTEAAQLTPALAQTYAYMHLPDKTKEIVEKTTDSLQRAKHLQFAIQGFCNSKSGK